MEDVVLLLVLVFEAALFNVRLARGRERFEPTSESSSSVVSGAERAFHLSPREGPRRSEANAFSSYMTAEISRGNHIGRLSQPFAGFPRLSGQSCRFSD